MDSTVVAVVQVLGSVVATLYGFHAVKRELAAELRAEKEARMRLEAAFAEHKKLAHGDA